MDCWRSADTVHRTAPLPPILRSQTPIDDDIRIRIPGSCPTEFGDLPHLLRRCIVVPWHPERKPYASCRVHNRRENWHVISRAPGRPPYFPGGTPLILPAARSPRREWREEKAVRLATVIHRWPGISHLPIRELLAVTGCYATRECLSCRGGAMTSEIPGRHPAGPGGQQRC